MKGFATVLILFVLAAFSPAPIFDSHAPREISPERSQQQREIDQSYQAAQGVVGTVPKVTDHAVVPLAGDDKGGAIVSGVQGELRSAGSNKHSGDILRTAEQDVQSASRRGAPVGMFLFVLGAMVSGMFAFRKWADKNIPEPKFKTRGRW